MRLRMLHRNRICKQKKQDSKDETDDEDLPPLLCLYEEKPEEQSGCRKWETFAAVNSVDEKEFTGLPKVLNKPNL